MIVVRPAAAGAIGVDTITRLDKVSAFRLHSSGIGFAVRYVESLGKRELAAILNSGMAVMGVGYSRRAGWHPSAALGLHDGATVASHAKAAGMLPNTTLWCDLEGIGGNATQTAEYANAWWKIIQDTGFTAGVYVGDGVPLTSDELYHALAFKHYWKSASTVPEVAVRGYQMVQQTPLDITLDGVRVDRDVIQVDAKGEVPFWMVDDSISAHLQGLVG